MKRIIALLDEKNHYLEKFYAVNESALKEYLEGRFEGLEGFYETREKILEIVKYIDAQIESAHARGPADPIREEDRRRLKTALAVKDQYVSHIMEQDLQILSCIEAAKNSIIRELQDLRKGRKAVAGYRAPTFGKRLDEEA